MDFGDSDTGTGGVSLPAGWTRMADLNAVASAAPDSDLSRGIRLLFEPLLALWALWSTAAWRDRPRRKR